MAFNKARTSVINALIILCVSQFGLFGQQITISGYVEDSESGERLIGCNIYDLQNQQGTITNNFGFFSYTTNQQDSVALVFSYIGYNQNTQVFNGEQSSNINVSLVPESIISEVEIVAKNERRIENETQMSVAEVPILQIKKMPALLGEVDVLKALQLLPGVQSGGEGQSGLYVRGGSPDQNLVLLDGVPVYNVSHLFGFFSVFNADAIKSVKLIKGGFPARYGGRLSSVLEINMKEGHDQSMHGAFSVGVVASKLTLEGPISKGKTSFLLSGRRTYIDLLARPFIKKGFENDGQDGNAGYYFYDINAKINHNFSQKDRLFFSLYTGDDKFYFNAKDNGLDIVDAYKFDLGWGNLTSALRWNHLFTDKLFSNATLTYSRYNLITKVGVATEQNSTQNIDSYDLAYDSGINDVAFKIDFDYVPNPKHFIRFGGNVIRHRFNPGLFELERIDTDANYFYKEEIGQEKVNAYEMSMYVEDDFELTPKFKVNVGLHASGFKVDDKFYKSLQPRFSSRYLLSESLSAKLSFATMRQFINLLTFEGAGAPTDLWLPTTGRIKPQESWQAAFGLAKTLNNGYEISLEGYYKDMRNLLSYAEGSGLFEVTDWQTRVTQGDGKSYGLELFFQKKTGPLTGWLGYTLSWSNRTFDDLNGGRTFPFKYDRRHDISLVAVYDISERINISANWIYGTGNATTLANTQYILTSQTGNNTSWRTVNGYDQRNGYRLKPYHRFDFNINFVKEKKRVTRTWSLGAYNVYSRKNPYFVYFDYDFDSDREVLKQVSLFPIIPYATYSFKF